MAAHSPRLWWFAVALLLWAPHAHCREFTHEDIREALLSLVHMIRTSEGKLERHEFREKALGETLKKLLLGLDKKHRALEPLIGKISRLDERLSNVETILLQKEEREKTSQTKIHEALDNIQKSLQTLATPTPTVQADLDNSLTATDNTLLRRLDATDAKIDAVKKDIKSLKKDFNKETLRTMCLDVASDINPFEKHIAKTEELLNKYESRLNDYNGTAHKAQPDFGLNEVSLADEAWHSQMTEVMERQEKEVSKIQRLLSDAESMWKDLPRLADLNRSTNQTIDAISTAKDTIVTNTNQSTDKVVQKIRDMGDRLLTTNKDIQGSLTDSNALTERAYGDISRSYDSLRNEVQVLTTSHHILLETHDNVLATKKRIEYAVNQILMDVGLLIREQHKSMFKTFNHKLNQIESAIKDNQTNGINNLTSKIESEMTQVWRQIGIMYQEITISKGALDALTDDTQQYANTSTTTMNKVKTEVSDILAKIVELGENLNHALGQLSVETQEFQLMSKDLSKALNNIKESGQTTAKPKVSGPGPHPIVGNE